MAPKHFLFEFLRSLLTQAALLFGFMLFLRVVEFITLAPISPADEAGHFTFARAVLQNEAGFVGFYLVTLGWIIALLAAFRGRLARVLFTVLLVLVLLVFFASTQFYYTTQLLLDKVVFYFTWSELKVIIGSETGTIASEYLRLYILGVLGLSVVSIAVFAVRRNGKWLNATVVAAFAIWLVFQASALIFPVGDMSRPATQAALSKTEHFAESVRATLLPDLTPKTPFETEVARYRSFMGLRDVSGQTQYPLARVFHAERNNLRSYFDPFDGPPNVVMVFCEGLSSSFSGPDAHYGDMTPNLDSLYARGLYWPNALSNTDRTHGIFANALASMPHGFERGVLNLRVDTFPEHFSLPKYLVKNGYDAALLYGGWAYFDNYEPFMRKNYVDKIYGEKFFQDKYGAALFEPENEFSWGIPDRPFFDLYFKLKPEDRLKEPYLAVLLNQSLHSPFKVPDHAHYVAMAEQRFASQGGDRDFFESHRDKFAAIAYMDEALGRFMRAYRLRKDFDNTIFVFVGDHNFFGFPLLNELDKHHVPLVIYSPKLKAAHKFKDIVAQTDIPASLTKLLRPYLSGTKPPIYSNWMSAGLGTANKFSASTPIFIGTYSGTVQGVVRHDTVYIEDVLYKIEPGMRMQPLRDKSVEQRFEDALRAYRDLNKFTIERNRLLLDPDSLYLNRPAALYFGE